MEEIDNGIITDWSGNFTRTESSLMLSLGFARTTPVLTLALVHATKCQLTFIPWRYQTMIISILASLLQFSSMTEFQKSGKNEFLCYPVEFDGLWNSATTMSRGKYSNRGISCTQEGGCWRSPIPILDVTAGVGQGSVYLTIFSCFMGDLPSIINFKVRLWDHQW